jgi:pilus assembly protein FimV
MMVLRKLAVALLSAGVLLPGLGHALAVKELQTKSALGEPFQAEIELIEVGDLAPGEIKVSLATQDDFDRMGIERSYFLSELKFDVVLNPGDRSFIKVTSAKPVVEPYLDFVVRIAWPGNARLQEVTALLDPPVVADTAAPEVNAAVASAPELPAAAPAESPAPVAPEAAPPVSATDSEPPTPVVAEPQPAPQPVPQPAPVAAAPTPDPVAAAPDSYRTKSGDTMAGIAQQFRPADASTAQAMIAIQRANPGAFAKDNINLLKRGQVLRIPSESQMREISAQEALASVREQTQAWRATAPAPVAKPKLEGQQIDATAKDPVKAPEPVAESKAEMKLLGANAGKSGAAAAGTEKGAVVKPEEARKLKDVQAKTESAKTDKKKLSGKVEGLEAKIKDNDKQVELQNARLAELDAQLKQQQAKQEAAKAAAASAAAPAAATPAKPETTPAPEQTPAPTTAEATPAPTPAAEPAPAPAPAKPVVAAEPTPEESGSLLPLIAGIGGALALILGGGWWWNQKRRRDQAGGDAGMDDGGDAGEMADELSFSADAGPVDDDWLSAPAAAAGSDQVLADPIEEADQYIAYERWPQAVALLNKAVAQNPDRGDLRMKLLECLAHTGDMKAFGEQQAWFESTGDLDSLARAEELRGGRSAAPAAADDDFSFDLDVGAAPAANAGHDLPSLEDMEMDFNSTVSVSSPALDTVKDSDLDFSLDTDLEPAASTAASDGLDFDFDSSSFEEPAAAKTNSGLDFSLDDEPAAPASSAAVDLGLGELEDFENIPDLTPEPSKPKAAKVESDDLSFSLDDLEFAAEPGALEEPAADLSLDADFSLEESFDEGLGAAAVEPSFEETVRANAAETGLDEFSIDLDDEATLAQPAPAAAPAVAAAVAAPAAAADAGIDLGMDDEFDFLADTDENATKLDLARAYIDMGDMEGARDILQEVLSEGSAPQKDEAKGLLAQVG